VGGNPRSHLAVDADGRVLDPGAIYHGGVLVADGVGAATVTVYDGINTNGDVIDYFYAATSQRDTHWLGEGIELRRGLYVDLGSNVSKFTVYYQPTPREKG
jgi:hypothetical protein